MDHLSCLLFPLLYTKGNLKTDNRWLDAVNVKRRSDLIDREVRAQALAWVIVLSPQSRHFPITVPLSVQVYKWVAAKLMLGVTLQWTSIPSKGE